MFWHAGEFPYVVGRAVDTDLFSFFTPEVLFFSYFSCPFSRNVCLTVWLHEHAINGCMYFYYVMHETGCVFVQMWELGFAFVHYRLKAQYPSHSPMVSAWVFFDQDCHLLVFYSGPRAKMTVELSRFAHPASQRPQIWLSFPTRSPIWDDFFRSVPMSQNFSLVLTRS